ncbi:MAG: alkaline phosphatase family protein [Anaerolineae bacterium]|nr:alkaline phosphatase family protein [Anaerolineae bacterium]
MRTVLLGLDAFSPVIFERLVEQNRLPHLEQMVQQGAYDRLAVANPPQSEVSWTSIATGLDAGGHGMFDFVHRDPQTYGLTVSLLPTQRGLLGVQFVPPFNARTIFDQVLDDGYPATALWWPAMFPARPQSPLQVIPGLGTPDIHGRLGVGTLFTADTQHPPRLGKSKVRYLRQESSSRYQAQIAGPLRRQRGRYQDSLLDLHLEIQDEQSALVHIGRQTISLRLGQWSPVLELSFPMGWFLRAKVVTRLILIQLKGEVRLYMLPLQIHPLTSPWHYAAPRPFIQKIWRHFGPFLTLGWPQDTTGLEDGCINDEQFLALCDTIFASREAILTHLLNRFHEGILAAVFDSLDRIQHMFWRTRPDVIESWYVRLDGLVGRVQQQLSARGKTAPQLMVLSDHGFAHFDYKVHLNCWLGEQGYLQGEFASSQENLASVRWGKTQAYSVGLNSLYLNLANREGQGIVAPDAAAPLLAQLREQLLAWRGPDGQLVVQQVWTRDEAYCGPLAAYGPDMLIGYAPGYRASAETGLGGWGQNSLEPNRDHWHGDHCFAPESVPGVLFAPELRHRVTHPSYRDIPALAIGKDVSGGAVSPPPLTDEEQEIVQQRLKELGYL